MGVHLMQEKYWATFVSDGGRRASNIWFWRNRVEIDALRLCVNIQPRASLWLSRSLPVSITYRLGRSQKVG